jgi:bacteriorhodopsin
MSFALAQIGPRILIPSFFVGQRVINMSDPKDIAQTIAFSSLFICFALTVFSDHAWLAAIPGVAAWAYWGMLHERGKTNYYRYADWAITTPIMLLALLVSQGTELMATAAIVLLDIFMIYAGYKGAAESEDKKKIHWFALGCLAFLPIIYVMLSMTKSKKAVILTLIVWLLYPVVWLLDEQRKISNTTTTVSYSIMDVIAKVGLVSLLKF